MKDDKKNRSLDLLRGVGIGLNKLADEFVLIYLKSIFIHTAADAYIVAIFVPNKSRDFKIIRDRKDRATVIRKWGRTASSVFSY